MIQTETLAPYKKPPGWQLERRYAMMLYEQQSSGMVRFQSSIDHIGKKTPAGEGKPAEAEYLSVWWQDAAVARTADKHTYSCTWICSLSCKHLLNSSPRSSVSYYLICFSKCSLQQKSPTITDCSVAWASRQGV